MIRKLLIHAVKELTKTAQQGILAEIINRDKMIDKLTSMKELSGNESFFTIASTFLKCRLVIFISQKNNELLPNEYSPYYEMDSSIFDLTS